MWTGDYLARIGHAGPLERTAETLRALHQRHLLAVPFENLDIHWKRPIVVDLDRFLHKIIRERRGGFCYELNGAFAALLRELGFEVKLLSGRVLCADGTYGPPFDHMTLLVDGQWIADVGFGESSLVPLRMDGTPEAGYRVIDGRYEAWREGEWRTEYYFDPQPHELAEFAAMCDVQQSSPQSPFRKKKVCTLATSEGRITLTGDRLIVTRNGARDERPVAPEEWERVLLERFGIRPCDARA